jgi:hypothetical protein
MKHKAVLVALFLSVGMLVGHVQAAQAEGCKAVERLCTRTEVLHTLQNQEMGVGNAKIVFANVGDANLAFIVSDNKQSRFFAVTVATATYSESPSLANVGSAIAAFRLSYKGEAQVLFGDPESLDAFVSLAGRAFASGEVSITVPLSDFVH